jgi:hypothetical protein
MILDRVMMQLSSSEKGLGGYRIDVVSLNSQWGKSSALEEATCDRSGVVVGEGDSHACREKCTQSHQ